MEYYSYCIGGPYPIYTTRGNIFTEVRSAKVHHRGRIEGMDRPTVPNILYTVSAQKTDLLAETASHNDAIFPRSVYPIYQTSSQCLSFYGCAITIVYTLYTNSRIVGSHLTSSSFHYL